MKRSIFLPIISLCAFLALFTVISCDKTKIVEEDLNGFDARPHNIELLKEQFARAALEQGVKVDLETQPYIRIDAQGNQHIYQSEDHYRRIKSQRTGDPYLKLQNGSGGHVWDDIIVWYRGTDDVYHLLAILSNSVAFVYLPWDVYTCNGYFDLLAEVYPYQSDCAPLDARFYNNNNILIDVDAWDLEETGQNPYANASHFAAVNGNYNQRNDLAIRTGWYCENPNDPMEGFFPCP